MIYITGDTHGGYSRFNMKNFPEQADMSKNDYVIICGDFGGIWSARGEDKEERYWFKWFEDKNFTLLFVDGNHENFERLYTYPVKVWNGGKVHEIRTGILHLMRGQVFQIEGKKFFTFGGASSHDMTGGILEPDDPRLREKKIQLNRKQLNYRINHIEWWKEELPDKDEMDEGTRNLAANDNKVDFVITHCAPSSIQAMKCVNNGREYQPDLLTDYLENIKNKVIYKKWIFGHYHANVNVSSKELLIYEQIIRIS